MENIAASQGPVNVSITINFTKDSIINVDAPLVLVHRIHMPILERTGASYELMVSATKNIEEEGEKMDKNEIPTKKQFTPPRQEPRFPDFPSPNQSRSPPPMATASGSKRPMENDELASLRAGLTHLTQVMNDFLEREAKRQAQAPPAPPLTPPPYMQPPY